MLADRLRWTRTDCNDVILTFCIRVTVRRDIKFSQVVT